jgi:hypothetical protein
MGSDKADQAWAFPNDYGRQSTMQLNPATSSPPGSSRSPALQSLAPPVPPPGALVERPPRKRGKLPKHVTDYLKEWLHHHSDHPYPSEDEKKQLCHTTGLSMSQVSNWMINVGVFIMSLINLQQLIMIVISFRKHRPVAVSSHLHSVQHQQQPLLQPLPTHTVVVVLHIPLP